MLSADNSTNNNETGTFKMTHKYIYMKLILHWRWCDSLFGSQECFSMEVRKLHRQYSLADMFFHSVLNNAVFILHTF